MSRVIKFRVWNGEQMISPDTIDRHGKARWTENSIPQMTDKVMQFTGLHDKNGKEIYEGDIISLIDDVGDEILVICEFGTVQREIYGQTLNLCDITGFYFRKDNRATFPIVNNYAGKHDLELFEVIGNIHQNPELL